MLLRHTVAALLLALSCALPVSADIVVSGGGGAGGPTPTSTVAGLPTCDNTNQGARRTVTDASTSSTCATGGGSSRNVCRCDDNVWTLEGSAALDAGDKGDITVGALWEIDAGAVGANELAVNACTEPKLDFIDSPDDEEALTYEMTGGRFEWEPRISGATTNGGLVTAGAAGAPTLGLRTDCAANQIPKYVSSVWVCANDDTGGGGGAPTNVPYIVADDPNSALSAEVKPGSGNQVPVSITSTSVAWGQVPAAAIASDAISEAKLQCLNPPADEASLTYEGTGTAFNWEQRVSGATGGINSGLETTGTPLTIGLRTDCATGYILKRDGSGWGCYLPSTEAYDPCLGDSRCFVLSDADSDTDWADDLQKKLNDLTYSSYTTAVASGEKINDDQDTGGDDLGFFGLASSGLDNTATPYDELVNGTVAILLGGTCSNGAGLTATINPSGTLTGNVSSAAVSQGTVDINCSSSTCTSGSAGVVYLLGPVDIGSVLCHRSGATDINFAADGSCTGSASTCNVTAAGSLALVWNAGSGITTCEHDQKATNTVNWQTNGAENGQISGRWSSLSSSGNTTCTYSYVTSANGGITNSTITIAPPNPTTTPSIAFKSKANYCRDWNSSTPTGYTVQPCSSTTSASVADLPGIRFTKDWDRTEIVCDPTLTGSNVQDYCFKIGDEWNDPDSLANRLGVEMLGAPLVTITKASVAAPSFLYGFWFDGVDDSLIQLRMEVQGDDDVVPLVFVGDTSTVAIGSRPTANAGYLADVMIDGPLSTDLKIIGMAQNAYRNANFVYLGSQKTGYYDTPGDQGVAPNANGCSYGTSTEFDTCDSITTIGLDTVGGVKMFGVPRDIAIVNHIGNVEPVIAPTALGASNGYTVAGQFAPITGPMHIDCSDCPLVRLHGSSAAGFGAELVQPTRGPIFITGKADQVVNDSMTYGSKYKNYTKLMLDAVSSIYDPQINLTRQVSGFLGAGLIDYEGAPDYIWHVGDNAGAVTGTPKWMRILGAATAGLSTSQTARDTYYVDRTKRTFITALEVRLLSAVNSTSTECEVAIEIEGACTACTTAAGEPAAGYVAKIGGKDVWNTDLRAAGDFTRWGINDVLPAGSRVTAEIRPVSGGTACTAGSGCSCDDVDSLEVTLDTMPAFSDQ